MLTGPGGARERSLRVAREVTLAKHERIVDLIAARDADGAGTMMRHHLDRSLELYAPYENGDSA